MSEEKDVKTPAVDDGGSCCNGCAGCCGGCGDEETEEESEKE